MKSEPDVLTKPADIRKAIHQVLSDGAGRRIAIVAFVGADALDYLPSPKGIELYCWPKAGGTHPDAIRSLLKAGVEVHFVDRLHMKLYWSKNRGAVLGSANLTNNALGDHGLHELVMRVKPGRVDAPAIVRRLKPIKDFKKTLDRLQIEHVAHYQRNPAWDRGAKPPKGKGKKLRFRSFGEWLAQRENAPEWRLAWANGYHEAPRDAVAQLEEEEGWETHDHYSGTETPGQLKKNSFALGFFVAENDGGRVSVKELEWWVPEVRKESQQKGWTDYPFIWFGRKNLHRSVAPPFELKDPAFKRALRKTIEELGGMEYLCGLTVLKPTKKFLRILSQHYTGK